MLSLQVVLVSSDGRAANMMLMLMKQEVLDEHDPPPSPTLLRSSGVTAQLSHPLKVLHVYFRGRLLLGVMGPDVRL